MHALDPKKLRLNPKYRFNSTATTDNSKAPQHQKGERFLKGPIPWHWLCQAAPLKGKALAVAIALWHLAGMTGNNATVKLGQKTLRQLGIKRTTGYRALRLLETAGLVRVQRSRGRLPIVTILPVEDSAHG